MSDTREAGVPEPAVLRRMFEIVTAISRTDAEFRKLLLSGRARCTYYSPKGQECISAGIGALVRRDDHVVTTYPGLHDHLGKGVPMRELFAEFLGRATGTCKGKGGPMHVTHPATGLMVTTGIVGSGLPIANGLAWSGGSRASDRPCPCRSRWPARGTQRTAPALARPCPGGRAGPGTS